MIAGALSHIDRERKGEGIYEITYMCDTMADGDMIYGVGKCVIEFYD